MLLVAMAVLVHLANVTMSIFVVSRNVLPLLRIFVPKPVLTVNPVWILFARGYPVWNPVEFPVMISRMLPVTAQTYSLEWAALKFAQLPQPMIMIQSSAFLALIVEGALPRH